MRPPLSLFLTWTTYGTWLPGDERGWVNRNSNCPGRPVNPPSESLQASAQANMTSPEIRLTEQHRQIVESAIADVCAFRDWELLEINCRSNHIHVVVQCGDIEPSKVQYQFKAYATRALKAAGVCPEGKVWTRGGSARQLFSKDSVAAACQYVRNQ